MAAFLARPIRNSAHAARQVLPHLRPARGQGELRDDLVVADQRAGDQLREEGDEGGELQQAVDVAVAAAQVDQVADLLEGEEADAQRQHDRPGLEAGAQQPGDAASGEVGVFAHAEHAQVQRDPRREPGIRPPTQVGPRTSQLAMVSPTSSGTNRTSQPAVEHQRRRHQYGLPGRRLRGRGVVQRQHGGQEAKDEELRVEQHRDGGTP